MVMINGTVLAPEWIVLLKIYMKLNVQGIKNDYKLNIQGIKMIIR